MKYLYFVLICFVVNVTYCQQPNVNVTIVNKQSTYTKMDSMQLQIVVENIIDSIEVIISTQFDKDNKWLTDKVNVLYGALIKKGFAIGKNGTYNFTLSSLQLTNLITYNSHDKYRIKIEVAPIKYINISKWFLLETFSKTFKFSNK